MITIGQITKIDPPKKGSDKKTFIRVYFDVRQEGGGITWARTDLCPTFRNYSRWKPLLKVGNVLSGLDFKGLTTVNADSFPKLSREKMPAGAEKPEIAPVAARALPEEKPIKNGIVIQHRQTKLYLEIVNYRTVHANDVYGDREDATKFGTKQEAMDAFTKLGLQPEHFAMLGPKGK